MSACGYFKQKTYGPLELRLLLSPADMTQRTDSLGLELNAKALFQGAIREQFREHA